MNSEYNSGQQIFQKLRNNIERLKVQREELNNQINIDRGDLNNVEMAISQLNRELEDRMNVVRQKERRLMQLQKAINETQKSYQMIVQTTRKLSNALENEAVHLKNMGRK